jgi:hypothetical protein
LRVGFLDLIHPIERRVVDQVRTLPEPDVHGGLTVAITPDGNSSVVLQQAPPGLGQREHAHTVPVMAGVQRARFDEALAGEALEVVVQTVYIAPVPIVSRV